MTFFHGGSYAKKQPAGQAGNSFTQYTSITKPFSCASGVNLGVDF